MSEEEKRLHRCCFTGHRPEKLPQGEVLEGLKTTLQYYIFRAVLKGYACFYDISQGVLLDMNDPKVYKLWQDGNSVRNIPV